jgi:lysophospholipase L1-like esterase
MKGIAIAAILLSVIFGVSFGVTVEQGRAYLDEKSIESAKRWEDTMASFQRWDSKTTFPENAILFIGSSSINGWATRECFADLPVINRGFGGSVYSDIIYWAEVLLKPYNPKIVVFYSGDNDPGIGKSPEKIVEDFKMVYAITRSMYPDAQVVVMATKISESRLRLKEAYIQANSLLKEFADDSSRLHYFDSASLLLDEEGKPDSNLYKSDKLHLNDKGYEIWSKHLKTLLKSLLE